MRRPLDRIGAHLGHREAQTKRIAQLDPIQEDDVEIQNGLGMKVLQRELRVPAQQHPFSSYAGLVSRSPERRHIHRRSKKDSGP